MADYELHGQTPSVCFITGAIVEDDGEVKVYYGGADTVMCAGAIELKAFINLCLDKQCFHFQERLVRVSSKQSE